MLKNILGVIGGYISMAVVVFVCFTIAYLVLGAEGSFQEGTYDVSFVWVIISIVLGFLAAMLGGFVCILIAGKKKAAMFLAGLVFVLGIIFAIPAMSASDEDKPLIRDSSVDNMEAMQNAIQPTWMSLLNPLLGAFGVMVGAGLRKKPEINS